MSKLVLLSGCAFLAMAVGANAADLVPTKKAPMAPAPVGVNWDGFYIGVNGGEAYGWDHWSDPTGGLVATTPRFPASGKTIGEFGGVTLGFNKQMGAWVLGAEGDLDAASSWGHAICGGVWGVGGVPWKCIDGDSVLGTLTARAGYAVGRSLFYGKAGLAYEDDKATVTTFNGGPGIPSPTSSGTQSRVGWTVGAGVEYALSPSWSIKGEYDLLGFGKRAFASADPNYPILGTFGASVSSLESLFKFGVNYRFGGQAFPVSDPAPAFASDITGEFGARTGWSSGYFRKNLFSPTVAGQLNSRLTWANEQGVPLEAFARLDHTSGVFAKGFIGGVDLLGEHMHDEDFPPAIAPYSNTVSTTKNGRDIYGTFDLGYALAVMPGWKLGGFVGYNHYTEVNNAYGCTQVATNPGVCTPAGFVGPGELTLSENQAWDSMRLGLNLQANLTDRFKLDLDGAWLPISVFTATDNHWLRPDINPLTETGHGSGGYQLEGVLSYRVTDRMSVGVGARYWSFATTTGSTQFPGAGLPSSPEKFVSNRTTVFGQVSYALGGAGY